VRGRLTGEGADGSLGGYSNYESACVKAADALAPHPASPLPALVALPVALQGIDLRSLADRAGARYRTIPNVFDVLLPRVFTPQFWRRRGADVRTLAAPAARANSAHYLDRLLRNRREAVAPTICSPRWIARR
jgi:hypothetical protein